MAPQHVQWGTITLYLDDETFRKSFTNGRGMSFAASEYEYPHVAHPMNTLAAIGSVLDEDGKGSCRFDRMTFKNAIDILGFAPSLPERPDHRRIPRGARRTPPSLRGSPGRSKPNRNSFVERPVEDEKDGTVSPPSRKERHAPDHHRKTEAAHDNGPVCRITHNESLLS
jgi:hypothetical protein